MSFRRAMVFREGVTDKIKGAEPKVLPLRLDIRLSWNVEMVVQSLERGIVKTGIICQNSISCQIGKLCSGHGRMDAFQQAEIK